MTVVSLDHERAARMQADADAFMEMEVDLNDIVQLARISNLLCEDLPGDRRTAMLHFTVTNLADKIDAMHRKHYGRGKSS